MERSTKCQIGEMKFACRMPIEILSKGIQGAFKDKIAFADSILLLLIENNPCIYGGQPEEKYYRLASSKGYRMNSSKR